MKRADAVVIGAGFGGLGAALSLAERGCAVSLFETLRYPGGCASTFTKQGDRFETGATLFAGLTAEGFFGRWLRHHGQALEVHQPDPVVVLHTPQWSLPVDADRDAFIERLCGFPDAPTSAIRSWFALQGRVADALWPLLNDPARLPPFDAAALAWHLKRFGRYRPLLSLVGKSVIQVLRSHGLEDFAPLRLWLNATAQITIQCSIDRAEAVMALATADYFFRGAGHVHGGVGNLATAMVDAIETNGGQVSLGDRVKAARWRPESQTWLVESRRHRVETPVLIANLLPSATAALTGQTGRRLRRMERAVTDSWGACMLYLAVTPAAVQRQEAHHLELVLDPTAPLIEGNHIFCSVSGADETDRSADGCRTVTISTHMVLRGDAPPPQSQVERVQSQMWQTLAELAPHLAEGTERQWRASPRTWQRFTGRPAGRVGGVPRTAGLRGYLGMVNRPVGPGLWIVGDSTFPGQSTLATCLGGAKLGARLAADLKTRPKLRALLPEATPLRTSPPAAVEQLTKRR